jgi:hypothetical protein
MTGMLVYDPINLENIPMSDYLDNDANNIVVILNKKAYGVNKGLFMFNNEMKRCIVRNNALLKQTTYDKPETFYNLGYFMGKKVIVNLDTLNDVLKTHRIIELTLKTTGHTYINKELLELTTIGLLKQPDNSIAKVNFKPAYEDVYFDKLISDFLEAYSYQLYEHINYQLLKPETYNNNEPLNKNLKEYNWLLYQHISKSKKTFNNIDFKNALDKVITSIDKVFIEAAPRYEKKYIHKVFYRGMWEKYKNTDGNDFENIGDTALILNYTSVSLKYTVAKEFAGRGLKSAIYIIYLDEGLPYINMVSTTRIKDEEEYLLPRNIIFELINKKGNEYTVLAKPLKKDQFTIKTGCFPLDLYDIVVPIVTPTVSPTKLSTSSTPKPKPKSKPKPKVDSGKAKDKAIPVKLKRCPNGMMRDKITNECVPKDTKVAKAVKTVKVVKPKTTISPKPKATAKATSPKPKAKLARCPNGTRRNPKTLLCEDYFAKLHEVKRS